MKILAVSLGSAVLGVLVAVLCSPNASLAESTSDAAAARGANAQPSIAAPVAPPQGTDESTLEIRPQRSKPDSGTVRRAPESGELNSGTGMTSFNPGAGMPTPAPLPYLGITARYTTKTYDGRKEHGLEIISVDPGSPAETAGLQGRVGATAVGSVERRASEMLGPLSSYTLPWLKKTGSLGQDGDVIVALDGESVRSREDLADKLAQLKPGDTLHLTVIRPQGHTRHETLKIAVTLGGAGRFVTAGPGGSLTTY